MGRAEIAGDLTIYITDTPKSKVQSAAQGFVELQGQCDFFGNRECQGLLAIWKKDRRWLHDEFDANSDGVIDGDEWEAVRDRAEVVTERLIEANATDPVNHMIGKPKNGMPFIISDRDPAPLGKPLWGCRPLICWWPQVVLCMPVRYSVRNGRSLELF